MQESDKELPIARADVIEAEVIEIGERKAFSRKPIRIIACVLGLTLFIGGGIATAYYKPFAKNQMSGGMQLVELPTTTGKLSLPEGEYEGEIKNSMANGKGKIIYPNGDSFAGDFVNNKMSGTGKITYYKDGVPNTQELDAGKIMTAPGEFWPEPAGMNEPEPNDGFYHMRTDRPAGIVIYAIIFHEGFRAPGLKAVDVHIMARSNAKENELIQDRDEIISITGSTGKVYDMIETKRTGVNTNAFYENFQEQEITQYKDVSEKETTIVSIVVRRDGKLITVKPDKDTKYDTTLGVKKTAKATITSTAPTTTAAKPNTPAPV